MRLSANKTAAFVAAVAAPLLTLLVDQEVVTAMLATDLGTVIATAVVFLHVNNDEAAAALGAIKQPATPSAPAAAAPTPAAPVAPATIPTQPAPIDVLAADPNVPSAL